MDAKYVRLDTTADIEKFGMQFIKELKSRHKKFIRPARAKDFDNGIYSWFDEEHIAHFVNHPDNSSFCLNDLFFFLKNDYVRFLPLKNASDSLEYLVKTEEINVDIIIERLSLLPYKGRPKQDIWMVLDVLESYGVILRYWRERFLVLGGPETSNPKEFWEQVVKDAEDERELSNNELYNYGQKLNILKKKDWITLDEDTYDANEFWVKAWVKLHEEKS